MNTHNIAFPNIRRVDIDTFYDYGVRGMLSTLRRLRVCDFKVSAISTKTVMVKFNEK